MKKVLLSAIVIYGFLLAGALPSAADADKSRGWISDWCFTPLQIGVGYFDRSQIFDGTTNCLISSGMIMQRQKSAVISCAPLNVMQSNYFLQNAALLNITRDNWFLAAAPVNLIYENHGWLAGIFNLSFNSAGVQTGVANFGGMLQIGLLNISSKIQIGIFNQGGNIQFGLLNHNPHARFPWMIFFNAGFPAPEIKNQ